MNPLGKIGYDAWISGETTFLSETWDDVIGGENIQWGENLGNGVLSSVNSVAGNGIEAYANSLIPKVKVNNAPSNKATGKLLRNKAKQQYYIQRTQYRNNPRVYNTRHYRR